MELIIAAITLGFLGSFHCIGMCGPIALALPIHKASGIKKILLVLSYNFGRVATYLVFGAFAGLIGQSFFIAGYQQILSVTIGILILLTLFFSSGKRGAHILRSNLFSFFNTIKTKLGKLFLKSGLHSLFLIGLLNGLLPCGLVYIGIAGAIATGDIFRGALFMAVFGTGTIPVMLSLPLVGGIISVDARNKIRKTVPVIVGFMAILLILRGLNLGIPYVSPKVNTNIQGNSCHKIQANLYPKGIIKCQPESHKESTCNPSSNY
jgi:sulfite exporter TauE/SafE